MRSRRFSFRLPWPLADEVEKIAKDEGYEDASAMLLGACILLVQNHRRKAWVPAIANAKPKEQDYLIAKMLDFPVDMSQMMNVLKKLD